LDFYSFVFDVPKPHHLVLHFLATLYMSLAAQIKQQRAGKFNGFGVGNKLTKKVYPEPVRIFFVHFPYRFCDDIVQYFHETVLKWSIPILLCFCTN
jgi:hypothetical protein